MSTLKGRMFAYIFGGVHQGTAMRKYDPRSVRGSHITSLAFFCPKCGQIWARIESVDLPWYCVHQLCPLHGYGSLNHPYDPHDKFPSLPRPLLERELDIAILLGEEYWGILT